MQGETGDGAALQAPNSKAAAEQDAVTSGAADAKEPAAGHEATTEPHFVAPSSYLRPMSSGKQPVRDAGSRPSTRSGAMHPLDKEQIGGLVSCLLALKCLVVKYGLR